MRLNGLDLASARLNGFDINEAKLDGSIVFASEPQYIHSGLMALFKGDNKTNLSPTKSVWKNLAGTQNLGLLAFAYSDSSGWTGSSLLFDGADDRTNNVVLPNNILTLEATCMKVANREGGGPISSFWWSGGQTNNIGMRIGASADGTGWNYSVAHANGPYQSTGIYWPTGTKQTLALTYNPTTLELVFYINGIRRWSLANATVTPSKTMCIGAWATNNIYFRYNGHIYCARVYDRPLTADELLYNHNIDKVVYGI